MAFIVQATQDHSEKGVTQSFVVGSTVAYVETVAEAREQGQAMWPGATITVTPYDAAMPDIVADAAAKKADEILDIPDEMWGAGQTAT